MWSKMLDSWTDTSSMSQGSWDQETWDFRTAYLWCFASAVAAITTKQLLLDTHYRTTLSLLFLQLIVAQLIFHLLIKKKNATTEYQQIREAQTEGSFYSKKWKALKECASTLPSAVPLALSLPFLSGTLANFVNQRTMPMFFLLPYIFECFIVQTILRITNRRMCQRGPVFTSVAVLACYAIILFDEYRLDLRGHIFLFVGLSLLGLSNVLYTTSFARAIEKNPIITEQEFWERQVATTLPLAMVFTIIAALIAEGIPSALDGLWDCALNPLLYINLLIAGGALALGLTFTSYPSRSTVQVGGPMVDEDEGWKILLVTVFSMLLVVFCTPMVELTYYSPFQTLAFSIALVTTLGVNHFNTTVTRMKETWSPEPWSPDSRLSRWQPYLVGVTVILAINLVFLAWSSLTFALGSFGLDINMRTSLDMDYIPPRPLDIVVSLYQEDVHELRQVLDKIKALPNIAANFPEIHIYLKDPDADMSYVEEVTGATTVTRLDNSGREGGTYLHHILTQWDNLAAHTLFMQGGLAQGATPTAEQVVRRIKNYFNPDTGMLPLGLSETCACGDCSDRYGWEDDFSLVPKIYDSIYFRDEKYDENGTNLTSRFDFFGQESTLAEDDSNLANRLLDADSRPVHETDHEEPHCSDTLLVYKGQFIASAFRIRGTPHGREIYSSLNTTLLEPTSAAHVSKDAGGMLAPGLYDSLDQPYLGYAIERLWGVLLQCNNREIAWTCPSMLSGWRTGGGVWDCQCQDEQFLGWS